MSRRNALVEWIVQTRKMAKASDYASLKLVDKIYDMIGFVNPKVILRHEEFFNDICRRYHKDDWNPVYAVKDRRVRKKFFDGIEKRINKPHRKCSLAKSCHQLSGRSVAINRFLDTVISTAEEAAEFVVWQWFEIIDIMWDRPELVDPAIMNDEYVVERIKFVCAKRRKDNPLTNGISHRFGKYWKDESGKWHLERRKRF